MPNQERESNRYSDAELEEFKEILLRKLEKAKEEYAFLKEEIRSNNEASVDDRTYSSKIFEESANSMAKENISQLAERQKKFIKNLEDALMRIGNKTYGICRDTGKLISKERLKAVPHATLSIEAKNRQNR